MVNHYFQEEIVSLCPGFSFDSLLFSLSAYTNELPEMQRLDHHQLSLILDILGTPSIDDFYAINSQRSREYIRALPFRRKKNFMSLFPKANPAVRYIS